MRGLLKKGWDMTIVHKYVLVLLFLYRLLWGFFLYRFIDSIVTPLLARYPDDHPNPNATQLFLIEAQFRLLKTDLVNELIWILGGLLLLRMMITPLLNAGVFYSFHHAVEGEGTRVLHGMRHAWKSVTLLYGLESLCILLPVVWLFQLAKDLFLTGNSLNIWVQELLPYVLLWMAWGLAAHLIFRFMQFGAVTREGILKSMSLAIRRAWPLLSVTLVMIAFGLVLSVVAWAVSFLWSGFLAVVFHQAFHFIRSLLTLWTAATQYQVWSDSSS